MYATVQEAYQTPAFAAAQRRRRATGKSPVQEVAGDIENFTNLEKSLRDYAKQSPGVNGLPDAYAGQLNDYKFACKRYGVCPSGFGDLKEGFANFEQEDDVPTKQLGTVAAECRGLPTPNYAYPLSAEDKRRFDAAMATSLAPSTAAPQNARPPRPPTQPGRQTPVVDMDKVQGYEDDHDDLDDYLRVSQMKDAAADDAQTPLTRQTALAAAAPVPQPPLPMPTSPLSAFAPAPRPKASPWMDLLLFLAIGVFLIVLMEQIFKLALMTGMRDTMDILRPYLAAPPTPP